MSKVYFSHWLDLPTQSAVFCCRPDELITDAGETPNEEADAAIFRFVNGNRKTCHPSALEDILSTASYIIEVERVLRVQEHHGRAIRRHARYFVPVPSIVPTDKENFVEVHVKDAFGGKNPSKMASPRTRYRHKSYICKEHRPTNAWGKANLMRTVWLISREGIVNTMPLGEVNGYWVRCTLEKDWGDEV